MAITFKLKNIRDFFDLTYTYDIPSYQRDYKWDDLEIKTFIKDIKSFFLKLKETKNYDLNYFFGNIITQKTKSGSKESNKFDYYLIDGQQRLTTFYLFWKAIIDISVLNKWDSRSVLTIYYDNFNKNRTNTGEFKLSNKNSILKKYIFDTSFNNERLRKNYEIIFDELSIFLTSKEIYDDFISIIKHFVIGEVEITSEQNAEEIFENVNSKGKTLSLSELLKNKLLLMNNLIKKSEISKNVDNEHEISELNYKFEEKIITFFDEIENIQISIKKKNNNDLTHLLFKNENELIRSIMSWILKRNIETDEDVYKKNIKETLDTKYSSDYDNFGEIVEQLELSLNALKITNGIISHQTEASFYLNWIFKKSSAFSILVPIMIKEHIDKNNISVDDLASGKHSKIIDKIKEIYIMIVKSSIFSNGFSGKNLWKEIPSNIVIDEEINILETMKKILLKENQDDDDSLTLETYENKIKDNDFYKTDKSLLKSLLLLIENRKEIEKDGEIKTWSTLNEMFSSAKWTIEHIIPVTIKKDHENGIKWSNDLGDVEYQSLINKLGNLTLANQPMNSKMGNKSFEDKRKILFKSNLEINKDITSLNIFNVDSFNVRANILKKEIVDLLKIN